MHRNAHFLRLLASSKPNVKKKLVQYATKDQVDTLSELALNLLNGAIPLQPRQFNQFRRHAQKLRTLARKKGSMKQKKRLLVGRNQRGGMLPSLLPLLISLAPMVIEKLASKVMK